MSSSNTVSVGKAYTRLKGVHTSDALFVVIARAPSIMVISSACILGALRGVEGESSDGLDDAVNSFAIDRIE